MNLWMKQNVRSVKVLTKVLKINEKIVTELCGYGHFLI
jgi:hypothetical protein